VYARSPLGLSRTSMAFVVALHAAVVLSLFQMKLIAVPAPMAVLSVSLLTPAEVIKPKPKIVPPRPKPIERRPTPVQQPTQLAAAVDSPAPVAATVPPAPTIAAAPAPAASAPAAVPSQPRFDADYLDNPKPPYPAISRRLSEQGRVVLRVHVDADGRAADVQLHVSSGSSRLDQSALDTVRRWKFAPAKLGKEPIAAWVLVPIAFTLKD
jgi:protein TonB